MFEPIYYETETANGSKVKIKSEIKGSFTAWSGPTRYEYIFIDYLVDADFELINNLQLPNWNFDFTGRGMVLQKGKQDWGITKTQLEALKLKTPWIKLKT